MRELSTSSLYVITNGNNNLKNYKTLLGSIPLDAMRNNSSKLVNQDMDVVPLEDMNIYAECILRQVAENMHDSKLMSRYVEELTKKDREKWQQSQICMSMMKGGETPRPFSKPLNQFSISILSSLILLFCQSHSSSCGMDDAHFIVSVFMNYFENEPISIRFPSGSAT